MNGLTCMKVQNNIVLNSDLDGCVFDVKEDGAYITYTLPGGADPVSKKLGDNPFAATFSVRCAMWQSHYNFNGSINATAKLLYQDGRLSISILSTGRGIVYGGDYAWLDNITITDFTTL